ncbi:hypothetical protein EV192_107156 [Actinocrispum wychmicini]|uniref:Uncharacterized protein n=1 Tax=Actinocrispum wychmicini TaxID=1213861 RepID=A0A4R2J8U6_9PSEU|nr:hypothetical protein EV192_107156 [Actinocrispum wychmicini]
MRSTASSGRLKPSEWLSFRACSQSVNSCVPPPASVRISTLRPILPPLAVTGNCRNASRATAMWSAVVLLPALPGRSRIASGSPVPSMPWSTKDPSG